MPPGSSYNLLVAGDEVTCGGYPTQVEGALVTGESFYFRYRFGVASLAVGSSPETVSGRQNIAVECGGELDGVLAREEFEPLIMLLYRELMALRQDAKDGLWNKAIEQALQPQGVIR